MAKQLNLREKLSQNSSIVAIACMVALALCLAIIFWPESSPPPRGQAYFYNLATGDMLFADADLLAPFKNEANQDIVYAIVYGCGSCDEKDRFVAYVEKYTKAGKAAMKQLQDPDIKGAERTQLSEEAWGGRLRHDLDGPPDKWAPVNSDEALAIHNRAMEKCTDKGAAVECKPPRS